MESHQNTEQVVVNANPKDLSEPMKQVGITYEVVGDNLNIVTNLQTALSSIPMLQTYGAVNPNVQQTDIILKPYTYTGVVAMFFTALILPNIYKNSSANIIHVNSSILSIDDFGHQQKNTIMTFDFNRELFAKIDWDHIPAQNIMKLAPNFKLDKWYESRLAAE